MDEPAARQTDALEDREQDPGRAGIAAGADKGDLEGYGMKISVEQACPFCGQFIAIGTDEDTAPEERINLAKAKCGCPQAARERDIKEAMDKLEQICGADAVDNGFDYPLDDETMEICRRMIGYLIDEAVGEVQIRCVRGDRLKLKSDGKIVRITRKCQKQMML